MQNSFGPKLALPSKILAYTTAYHCEISVSYAQIFHKHAYLSYTCIYIYIYIYIPSFLQANGFSAHLYADDVQLYDYCTTSGAEALVDRTVRAIDDLSTWMSSNRLKLNPDKTQLIWLGGSRRTSQINMASIRLN